MRSRLLADPIARRHSPRRYHEVRGDAYLAKKDIAARRRPNTSGAGGCGCRRRQMPALLELKIADLGVPAPNLSRVSVDT